MIKPGKRGKPFRQLKLFIETTAGMLRAGGRMARVLPQGTKIGLSGELGAGKTTFVKGFASAYGISRDAVTSPTFTIINEYAGPPRIVHADLYRIATDDDLVRTGLYDTDTGSGFLLVEWPERFKSLANYLDLFLIFSIKKDGRVIEVKGRKEVLDRMADNKIFERGKRAWL
ncbi:MAG: tRNA (adenosine(37)-N6)-threonylcarbamoyltransferase complex ATPase subunit type 1 TsaE [Deltaproteobacteria bacterium]|nr:tRNA (adenosine(37)-N6)-threonylcarbamoyltransferase complex ATPase subunit type 1 TsaE [Deltaproteobacteria bacterium]MCL5277478.1 tRNA (adenosine(37)-N6)-threonylcarbamoyltransferase complex ATPase subunit type 1 TsaE [Deltaproteobacteria bacterium]